MTFSIHFLLSLQYYQTYVYAQNIVIQKVEKKIEKEKYCTTQTQLLINVIFQFLNVKVCFQYISKLEHPAKEIPSHF